MYLTNHQPAPCSQVSRLRKELLTCGEERDSAQLERDLLSSRLKHLESELDTERSSHIDRNREIRILEVRRHHEVTQGQRSRGLESLKMAGVNLGCVVMCQQVGFKGQMFS